MNLYKMNDKNKERNENYSENIELSYVPVSLEYFDKNQEIYENAYDDIKYYKIVSDGYIIFYDENKNEYTRSKYEIIGFFDNESKVWVWAWSVPHFNKNQTKIVRSIVNYGMELDPKNSNLKTELVTSRFIITNMIQLDMHVAIASYLARKPLIYKLILRKKTYFTNDIIFNVIKSYDELSNDDYIIYYVFLLDYENFKSNQL